MLDGESLREGLFALNTRRFGTVAEVMIQRLLGCAAAKNVFHDLFDDAANLRIEVKSSCVRKKSNTPISADTVLQCIEEATSEVRDVRFEEWTTSEFDCNIQQVKRTEFDVLYYGLFFSDCVKIFRIGSSEIGPRILYSDKQHKGNVGEGQFHVNQATLQGHLDTYLNASLTYNELLDLLR